MKKSRLIILLIPLFLTQNIYANEKKLYECTTNSVYDMASSKSLTFDGVGETQVTVDGNSVVIKTNVKDFSGTYNLKLSAISDLEIIAVNDSVSFIYSRTSHKFSLITGIGYSGFRPGIGHVGDQMLMAGLCTKI